MNVGMRHVILKSSGNRISFFFQSSGGVAARTVGASRWRGTSPRFDRWIGANAAVASPFRRTTMGRALLLWILGVPIPVIILIALLYHH
jgi:hypothetical protein